MVEFLQNPRRSPRAPVRCRVGIVSAQGMLEATTEDVGAHGCQLVSPRLIRKGEPVQLELTHELMKESLRLAGRVAWASERSPWRLGIAFDEGAHEQSARWFGRLLTTVPGLAPFHRIPDRIPVDASLYLASPPRFLVDFTPDEVALLRSIGSGAAVAELRAQLKDRWLPALRALFSLLAHNHVTLSRGGSVHPDAWKRILAEAESALAVESLHGAEQPALTPAPGFTPSPRPLGTRPAMRQAPTPPPAAWSPAPARAPTGAWPAAPAAPAAQGTPGSWPAVPVTGAWPAPAASPGWDGPAGAWPESPVAAPEAGALEGDEGPGSAEPWLASAAEMMSPSAWEAGAAPASRGSGRGIDGGAPWSSTPPPAPPGGRAAVPLVAPRSAEAQGCYDRALAELQAGRVVGGTVLLRRALALAPGDAEIAGALASASGPRRAK